MLIRNERRKVRSSDRKITDRMPDLSFSSPQPDRLQTRMSVANVTLQEWVARPYAFLLFLPGTHICSISYSIGWKTVAKGTSYQKDMFARYAEVAR